MFIVAPEPPPVTELPVVVPEVVELLPVVPDEVVLEDGVPPPVVPEPVPEDVVPELELGGIGAELADGSTGLCEGRRWGLSVG